MYVMYVCMYVCIVYVFIVCFYFVCAVPLKLSGLRHVNLDVYNNNNINNNNNNVAMTISYINTKRLFVYLEENISHSSFCNLVLMHMLTLIYLFFYYTANAKCNHDSPHMRSNIF